MHQEGVRDGLGRQLGRSILGDHPWRSPLCLMSRSLLLWSLKVCLLHINHYASTQFSDAIVM